MATLFTGFSTYNRTHKNNKLVDIELVKRDLLNHFHTRKGERVMQPEFGSIIWDMLFEPMTQSNKDLIEQDVESIINSDPRVEAAGVDVKSTETSITVYVKLYYIPLNAIDVLEVGFDRRAGEQ